jgi:cell division transport system ATP-binding protein
MIEFIDVTKEYGKNKAKDKKIKALDEVCLHVKQGEFICLVGPSGAGKSTLIKLLICEEKPNSGRILVFDRDITKFKRTDLPYYRRKLGVIFQDFKLLEHKTVYENIAFALEACEIKQKVIDDRVPKILDMVGLTARQNNYPDELSGGEKQRVAIARSLVHSPTIVVADEPTGNLDPKNTWEILEILEKINHSGSIVILATHDKEIVNHLKKRVVTVKDGKIISDQKNGKYID